MPHRTRRPTSPGLAALACALACALGACRPATALPRLPPEIREAETPRAEAGPPTAETGASRHQVLLWAYEDDAVQPAFLPGIRRLGATGLSMPSHRDLTPFADAGLQWYAEDAAGKSELTLAEHVWRPAWTRAWNERTTAWPSAGARERPTCLRDPEVRGSMLRRLAETTPRASGDGGPRAAAAISLADEPSITVRANPLDWCLCDRCVRAFRAEQVRAFDGDVGALNRAWDTDYRSWDEVLPWTTAAIRARCLGHEPEHWNLAPWIATRAFQDRTFATTLAGLREAARAVAPELPCGITGTQAPSAFGGWDYRLLTAGLDFLEPYDIGLALPVARDLGGDDLVLAQTVFPSPPDQRVAAWRLWRGIARGVDMTIVWSSRDALDVPWGEVATASVTEYGRAIAPALRALATPGGAGDRIHGARPVDGGVRILVSQPSLAVRWMLDSRADGDTWPRRFGSHEAETSGAIRSREAAWRALAEHAPRFLDARDVVDDEALRGVRVIVLPDALALSDETCRALRRFADRGGRLIADVRPGAWHADGRPAVGERLPDVLVDTDFAHTRAVVERSVGAPLLRVTATDEDGDPVPIEVGLRRRDGRTFAVLVPFWSVGVGPGGEATGKIEARTLDLRVEFGDGAARAVRDERTSRDLGEVDAWSAACPPEGGAIYSW